MKIKIDENMNDGDTQIVTTLEQFEEQARRLPLRERARLIQHLILSLDEPDEAECEQLWAEEAERRYEAYKSGTLVARPAEEALEDARARLSRLR